MKDNIVLIVFSIIFVIAVWYAVVGP